MERGTPSRDTAWAMSQENVALVRQSFDAWNEGGPEAAKQFWAEDFEWHDFPGLPDRRVVRGRDAVVAHLTDQLSLLGELRTTIVEVRVRGETVLLRTELTIHGAKSGIDVPGEVAQVWEVADGRVQRVRLFTTWQEALEAAGLRE
jgi:ketosteroid isomerase-like protein